MIADVLAGAERAHVDPGDNLDWLRCLPADCCALSVTSPPYEIARTYGVGFALKGQAWVDWMIPRVVEMCRVTRGLVCVVMSGQLEDGRYSPVVEWLAADLTRHHGLVCGPAPYCYFRFSIPGSGGKRYHRRDWEPVYCFARREVLPLAWSDNTALGHPPKWAPGGEMSHRMSDGARVNQWSKTGGHESGGQRGKDGRRQRNDRPSHVLITPGEPTPDLFGDAAQPDPGSKNAHGVMLNGAGNRRDTGKRRKTITREREGQHSQESTDYEPPVLANPGNVIRERYDAEEVRQLFEDLTTRQLDPSDVIRCLVGGNLMGPRSAHDNEAPFPERLAEFFVRSYAPPGSVVLDPFCGSGTTGAVAVRLGRRFLGCDLRESQVLLSRKRIANESPSLFSTPQLRSSPVEVPTLPTDEPYDRLLSAASRARLELANAGVAHAQTVRRLTDARLADDGARQALATYLANGAGTTRRAAQMTGLNLDIPQPVPLTAQALSLPVLDPPNLREPGTPVDTSKLHRTTLGPSRIAQHPSYWTCRVCKTPAPPKTKECPACKTALGQDCGYDLSEPLDWNVFDRRLSSHLGRIAGADHAQAVARALAAWCGVTSDRLVVQPLEAGNTLLPEPEPAPVLAPAFTPPAQPDHVTSVNPVQDWCTWTGGIDGLREVAKGWTDEQLTEAARRFSHSGSMPSEISIVHKEQQHRGLDLTPSDKTTKPKKPRAKKVAPPPEKKPTPPPSYVLGRHVSGATPAELSASYFLPAAQSRPQGDGPPAPVRFVILRPLPGSAFNGGAYACISEVWGCGDNSHGWTLRALYGADFFGLKYPRYTTAHDVGVLYEAHLEAHLDEYHTGLILRDEQGRDWFVGGTDSEVQVWESKPEPTLFPDEKAQVPA